MDLSRDPIINVWNNGIRRDIEVMLEHRRVRGACMLTLAGIDAMAFLGMADGQLDVTRADFTGWVDRYLQFDRGSTQVTGIELYAARCAFLHAHSTRSRLSREGECREVLWCFGMRPAVKAIAARPQYVMVAIDGFVEAFFKAVDCYLVDLFASPDRAKVAERRFQNIIHELPYPTGEPD